MTIPARSSIEFAPTDRLALRWAAARERLTAYLIAAGLAPRAAADASGTVTNRLAETVQPETADEAMLLALAETRRLLAGTPQSSDGLGGSVLPRVTPLQIRRQSLAPALRWRRGRWLPRPVLLNPRELHALEEADKAGSGTMLATAHGRRAVFIGLGVLTAAWAVSSFFEILAVNGVSLLDLVHTAVFTILVLWLSQSFWTLSAGFGVLLKRLLFGRSPKPPSGEVDRTARVALVMPIYNEETERVFAGLEAIWRDVRRVAPDDERLDLFILSDTTDPDVWLAEIEAWRRLRLAVGDLGRVFYRRRDRNVGRKAGNIEDFIRRFGANYGSMVILDADSVMTGQSILELVRRMDENPRVGLIQAPPKLVRGETLFARVLQFAGELYGPLAAAGTAFWAGGEGNYWGHNAIIRIKPFSELCGLPQLPGRAPLGGHILSHDFVEAALMRRGGWQVWIADDLSGSYEEPPPTIEDFAVRDRRWCQGNLQHVQILFARHLHWVSRTHLAIGIMSYLTSPLWLLFLILSAAQAWEVTHTQPLYFLEGYPFPILPVSVEAEATALLVITLGLLFVPKLMGLLLALLDGPRRRALGGGLKVTVSALLETVYSALLAPVMMLLHTSFVISILAGAAIDWTPQRRAAGQSQVLATARTFLWPTVIGVAALLGTWRATPLLFYWLSPVWAGLTCSIPLALAGGSERIGRWLQRHGLLLIAEERQLPEVMVALEAEGLPAREPEAAPERFARAVLEPQANALHVQLQRAFGTERQDGLADGWMLERKAIFVGPSSLSQAERRIILEEPELVERLHLMAWLHWPAFLPGILDVLKAGVGRTEKLPNLPAGTEAQPGGSRPAAAGTAAA